MALKPEEFELILYVGGGVIILLLLILVVAVGYLLKQVHKLTKNTAHDDDGIDDLRLPAGPASVKSSFALPKPNFSRNWHRAEEEPTDPTFHFSDGMLNHTEFGQNRFGAKSPKSNFENDRTHSMPSRNHENDFNFEGNRPNQMRKPDANFESGANRLKKPNFDLGGNRPRPNDPIDVARNTSSLHGAFRNPLIGTPDYDQDKNFSHGPQRDLRQNNAYY